MEQHNHREYSARDFERYYSGQMPAMEMHALEKAALEDPFLADALEGYQYTQTPVKDIAAIKDNLSKNKTKKKIFFLQDKMWPRVAASVILIAGIGYFAYQFNSTKKNNFSTYETKEIVKAAPDSTLTAKSDTTPKDQPLTSLNITEISPEKNKSDVAINNKSQKKVNKSFIALESKAAGMTYLKDKDAAGENNMVEGRIMDDKGNPIALATVKDLEKNVTTVTDSSGKFKLSTTDSVMTAKVTATGFKTKERELAKSQEQFIFMERDSKDLNEVVVTGSGTQRQKRDVGYAMAKKVPGVSVNDSLYGPEGGWQKFDQYVLNNIHAQANEAGNNYQGEVVLSFEVNKNGNPKKIKTVQSLCAACDKEATRLLLHGPKWKYSNGKRYEASINF